MTNKGQALVLKFGGSGAVNDHGANQDYLRKAISPLVDEILSLFQQATFIIGGGSRVRLLQAAVTTNAEKDQVGINATWEHAAGLANVLNQLNIPVDGPIPHSPEEAKKILASNQFVAMGGLQIGQSTDAVAAFAAQRYEKAGLDPLLVILSNVKCIYTADPNKNPDAKPIREANIELLVNAGVMTDNPDDWRPGMAVAIDPVATKILRGKTGKQTMRVFFGHGDNVEDVARILRGETPVSGTLLTPGLTEIKYY